MENKQNANTNDRKLTNRKKSSHATNRSTDYEDALDGINYDYDWNTDYGDGDIPDIDEP